MGISEKGYYNGLSISVDNDFQMHLKQLPNSCFVNNYLRTGLLAWEANLDKQPFFKHTKLSHTYERIYQKQRMSAHMQ